MVILPLWLRPPDFLLAATTNDFSGTLVVISAVLVSMRKRVPGVTGLNLFTAISVLYSAIKIYYFTIFQRYDSFLYRCSTGGYDTSFSVTAFQLPYVS